MLIPRHIREQQIKTSREFFSKLKQSDAIAVRAIVKTVRTLAKDYAVEQSIMFQDSDAFFGVYAIEENITKSGDRSDINLLIVTNAWWISGYQSANAEISDKDSNNLSGDWVAGTLRDIFVREGYKVEVREKIPSIHTNTDAKQKGMLYLVPDSEERKSINIEIFNKVSLKGSKIHSLEEFGQNIDAYSEGNSLQRILLFEA